MIDGLIDRAINAGTWLSGDMKRMHVFMFVLDLVVLGVCWLIAKEILSALQQVQQQSDLVRIPGRQVIALCSVSFLVIHFGITKAGNRMLGKGFTAVFFATALLFAGLGIWSSAAIKSSAVRQGYTQCETKRQTGVMRSWTLVARSSADCQPTAFLTYPNPVSNPDLTPEIPGAQELPS